MNVPTLVFQSGSNPVVTIALADRTVRAARDIEPHPVDTKYEQGPADLLPTAPPDPLQFSSTRATRLDVLDEMLD